MGHNFISEQEYLLPTQARMPHEWDKTGVIFPLIMNRVWIMWEGTGFLRKASLIEEGLTWISSINVKNISVKGYFKRIWANRTIKDSCHVWQSHLIKIPNPACNLYFINSKFNWGRLMFPVQFRGHYSHHVELYFYWLSRWEVFKKIQVIS